MNKLIKSIFVLLVGGIVINAQEISTENLIAYYPFSGNANDYSGNELHGTVEGATLTTDRFGEANSAYYFDGSYDYINLGNSQSLKPYPPITIAGWFFYYDWPAPFFDSELHPTNYYGITVNTTWSNKTQFSYNNGGLIGPNSRNSTYTEIPLQQQWFHFAATFDENLNVKIFINGFEVVTDHSGSGETLSYSDGYSYFGVHDSGQNEEPHFLHGKIDDFYLFNRILSDEEIATLALFNPGPAHYNLAIDTVTVLNTGTVDVPVNINIPLQTEFSSFEIAIKDFETADFVSVITDETTIVNDDWTISTNIYNSTLYLAGSSSKDISSQSSETLLKLQFKLDDSTTARTIPIILDDAAFDQGVTAVNMEDGAIVILDANSLVYGDIDFNDRVQAYDASQILKYLVGKAEFTELQKIVANVTLDSTVSGLDAQIILDYVTKKIESLPYSPDSSLTNFSGEFYMNDIAAYDNEYIKVPIFMTTESNIYSVAGEINYDNEKLVPVNLMWSDDFSNYTTDFNIDSGKLSFAAFGESSIESDTLLTLVFANTQYTENTSITLERIRINESNPINNAASANINIISDVDDKDLEFDYSLQQNYPNPFNPTTKITFSIPNSGKVSLEIFDVLGRKVTTLVNKDLASGNHEVEFDASELNSGIYLYRIAAGNFTDTKKMLLVK